MQKPEPQMTPDAVSELLAVIQAAVRATLRVSLRPSDGSQKNQDALELVNDGWIKLQKRLKEDPPVKNPKAYAHLTGKKLCFDYFRRQSARHRSVQDSALRYLRLISEFAAWKADGEWLTGFAKWEMDRAISPASGEALDACWKKEIS
jgi:DNA-directed RNA polymerase specialized sigma24 family protein